jgi:hypothetical protein
MSTPSAEKPTVVTAGKRCYIHVPSGRAAALLALLRRHGVSSDTPEPSSRDMESIALHRGVDVKKIQALLDGWA